MDGRCAVTKLLLLLLLLEAVVGVGVLDGQTIKPTSGEAGPSQSLCGEASGVTSVQPSANSSGVVQLEDALEYVRSRLLLPLLLSNSDCSARRRSVVLALPASDDVVYTVLTLLLLVSSAAPPAARRRLGVTSTKSVRSSISGGNHVSWCWCRSISRVNRRTVARKCFAVTLSARYLI